MSKFFYLILVVVLAGSLLYVYRMYQPRSSSPSQGYSDITSVQLKELLANKDFYLVNVHTPYAGEIEGTDAFIPYDEIAQNLDKLPNDKNAKIVLYCQSGRMSEIAAQELSDLGYTNVYNHLFGMHDWQSKGYKIWNK